MSFEITTHESAPAIDGRVATGLTAALRSLNLNQSVHVPVDGRAGSQRLRIAALCNAIGAGLFSVRIRPDRSFDVYRVKE